MFKNWLKENIRKEWTLQSAQEFVETIKNNFTGFDLKIVGGVQRLGFSEHDLDILLVPQYQHQNRSVNKEFLESLVERPDFRGVIYELTLPDGRNVDFFSHYSLYRLS